MPGRRASFNRATARARESSDWRGAIESTTPEMARWILANRTYIARVDVAVEDATRRPDEAERPVDRSLADRWARFGDRRDEGVDDSDIVDAYDTQVERDGPPEYEAAFRVARERVVESDGRGGLRVPGRLDQAITEASEQILSASDPDGTAAAGHRSEVGNDDANAAEIRAALMLYRPLADRDGIELRLHQVILYASIYRADDELLINQHIYGAPAAKVPVFHLRRARDGDMAPDHLTSFERIWTEATPCS